MRRSVKTGMEPGTPVYVGIQRHEAVRIDAMVYDCETCESYVDVPLERLEGLKSHEGVLWLNVIGIHDVDLVRSVGEIFGIHPLTIEDIVNTSQRPKGEDYPGYLFCVMNMLTYDDVARELELEHLRIVAGRTYVISFQEKEGDVFDAVRSRLSQGKSRLRQMGADHCLYALMDAIIDGYFLAIEKIGDGIESCEDDVFEHSDSVDLAVIHQYKREVIAFRKSVWPLREAISFLEKSDTPIISGDTRMYLRDLYDHTIQVIDMLEGYRDILGGIHDTYLSLSSNRMNEIMKVLTIIATVFIPMTFVAGVYGMNFEEMPELHWRYGYGICWVVMIAIGVSLVVYFRRKRWI